MSKRAWIIFVVICIAVLGGLVVLSRKDKADVSSTDQNSVIAASTANGDIADHVIGLKDSKVILIEYGDFQCPYCGEAYPNIKKIAEDYKSKITFVFRNYPLATMHANAKSAAAAAEAAGLQGKYWEMHDKLYETQKDWESLSPEQRTDAYVNYAKAVGVTDIEKFKTDMGGNNVNKKINFDLALGNKVQVSGTPTFILKGEKVSEAASSSTISGNATEMRKAIDEALAK